MKALRGREIISGFFLEDPLPSLPGITHCGEAFCSARHQLAPHVHRGFEFVYITRGRAFWRAGETEIRQHMGDLLVTYPGETHQTAGEPGIEFHLIWAGLDLDRLGGEGKHLAALLRARRPHLLTRCHEMEGPLRGLFSQVAAGRPLCERVARQHVRTFIALAEQRLRAGEARPGAAAAGPYSAGTAAALEFMAENVDRRVAIGEIAFRAKSGSPARFSVRFRREAGVSPGQYHRHLRLDAASQALRQPDSSITHVALRYGFSSSQHFGTAFRREFGLTPRQWQQGLTAAPRRSSGRRSSSSRAERDGS